MVCINVKNYAVKWYVLMLKTLCSEMLCINVLKKTCSEMLCIDVKNTMQWRALRSAIPGRSHPSPLCGAKSRPSLSALWYRGKTILLHSAVPVETIPLRSTLSVRDHPSPLCDTEARPSFSTLWYRWRPSLSALWYRGAANRGVLSWTEEPWYLCLWQACAASACSECAR